MMIRCLLHFTVLVLSYDALMNVTLNLLPLPCLLPLYLALYFYFLSYAIFIEQFNVFRLEL